MGSQAQHMEYHSQRSPTKGRACMKHQETGQIIHFIIMARSAKPAMVPATPSTPSIAKVSLIINLGAVVD